MPNQVAETPTVILVRELVCRVGLPKFIHSDQSTDFHKGCKIIWIATSGKLKSDQSCGAGSYLNQRIFNTDFLTKKIKSRYHRSMC